MIQNFIRKEKVKNVIRNSNAVADRSISVIVGILFFMFGFFMTGLLVYDEGPWFVRQFTWTTANAVVDEFEINGSEAMLTLSIFEDDGSSRVITKAYEIDEEDEIFVGKPMTALYNPSNIAEVHIHDHVSWGFPVSLAFFLIFMIVGYYLVSLKAQQRFREWNSDWRFYWALFLIAGLATLAMAIDPAEPSADSILQSQWAIRLVFILIGLPLAMVGSYGFFKIYKEHQATGK